MRKNTIIRIMNYLANYKLCVFLSLICAVVNVAMSLYVPIIIGRAIDCIVGSGVDFVKLYPLLGRALLAAITAMVSLWIMNEVNNQMTYNVVKDVRNDAIRKIEHLPIAFLDSNPSGNILSRVIADADQFADGLLMGFTQLFTGVMTIIGTLVFMFMMQPYITLFVLMVTPLSLFVARFIANNTYELFNVQSRIRGEQTELIDEMIGNAKIVKAFSYEDRAIDRFQQINNELNGASLKALFYSSLTNPSTRFVNSVVYAGVALIGAINVISGGMTVGVLTCFLSYANQYTKPFNEISGVLTELQNAFVCAGRVFELLDEAEETDNDELSLITDSVDGNVACEDVAFSYDKSRKLIEALNLDIKAGEHVAIVGPTGCGKTTIINLLMRFYDVDNGTIRIDGKDITKMSRESLRSSYGMVLQETWLRHGTIRDNILMGREDISDEEMIQAAREVHAHSFIRRLENGYDTVIGEDGGNLSQGQKQLLCIARVMLSIPPMLILDEATSSIDTRTEVKIQDAFLKMMSSRTAFIVAHRLSTIKNADMILVMKDGKIMETGNHEALLKAEGLYYTMYNSQFE